MANRTITKYARMHNDAPDRYMNDSLVALFESNYISY